MSKLHPIYVALDNHQFKQAIKLCLALPPSNVLGQALLAHSYAKSGQRYKALLTLQSILGSEGYQELQLEIQCALETRQQQLVAAAGSAASVSAGTDTSQQKTAATKKGGKKGKKKPPPASAVTATTSSTTPGPEIPQLNTTLVEHLDDPPTIDSNWETIPPPDKAILDETTLGTLAVTLQNLKLSLTVYQLYCCAASTNLTRDDSFILHKAYLAGLAVLATPHYECITTKILANMQVLAVQLAKFQLEEAGTNKSATSWAAQAALWQLTILPSPTSKSASSLIVVDDEKLQQQRLALLPRLAETFALKCINASGGMDATNNDNTDSNQIHAEDYFLYLRALESQSKWQDMLSVLENDFSKAGLMLATKQQVLEQKTDVLRKLEQFQDAKLVYEQLLTDYPDNWTYWKGHLDCSIGEHTDGGAGSDGIGKAILQTEQLVTQVIAENEQDSSSNYPLRGPPLMIVELAAYPIRRLIENQTEEIPEEFIGKLVQQIIHYGDSFCSRVSCAYTDLLPYLDILLKVSNINQIETLLDWLKNLRLSAQLLNNTEDTEDNNTREQRSQLRKYIFSIQMTLKALAQHKDIYETWKPDWKELVRIWRKTRVRKDSSDGSAGDQTNMQGDELILLAVQQVLYQDPSGKSELFAAASLLESGLKHSPGNANFKVAAMHLNAQQCAVSRSWELFKDVQIKHVQLDSCSFVVLPQLISGGYYLEAIDVCQEILRLHTSLVRDTGEFSGRAMKNGTLSKAEEFLLFQREKMGRSLTALEAKGIILDIAPFFFDDAKKDSRLGAKQGIVGGEFDFDRALQMVVETRNPFGALSLLSATVTPLSTMAGTATEAVYSDNRDFSIFSHEILVHREVDTKEQIINASMRRGYYHALLIRAALCVKNTKGVKKGKLVKASDELCQCCTSLLKTVDLASDFCSKHSQHIEGYKELMEATLALCRTLSVISAGISNSNGVTDEGKDTVDSREEKATEYLKNARSHVQQASLKLALSKDIQYSSVARVCRLLPDCIVPFFALLRICSDVMDLFGLGKKKRKSKPSSEALVLLAIDFAEIIDASKLCVQILIKDDVFVDTENSLLKELKNGLVDDDIMNKMFSKLTDSHRKSYDRVDPILNEIKLHLDTFNL